MFHKKSMGVPLAAKYVVFLFILVLSVFVLPVLFCVLSFLFFFLSSLSSHNSHAIVGTGARIRVY